MSNSGKISGNKFRIISGTVLAALLSVAVIQANAELARPAYVFFTGLAAVALACLIGFAFSRLRGRPGIKEPLSPLAYAQPLILAVIAYLVVSRFAALGVDPHHDGIMFTPALDVAEGKILFRDTFAQYGALTTLLQALALKLFGKYLLVIRLETAFFYAAAVYFLWLVWKRFIPQWLATACGLVYILLLPVWDYGFMPWSSVTALFFLSLSLYFLVLFTEKRARPYACAAGVSTALTLWSRQPVGGLLFCAVSCFLVWRVLREKSGAKTFIKDFAVFAAGFLAVNAVFLCWLALNGALKDMWLQSVALPFMWAENFMAVPVPKPLASVFFPHDYFFFPYLPYVWFSLPAVCLLLFFRQLAGYFLKEAPDAKSTAILAAAVVCLASWGQYYPIPCPNHTFWAAAPMLGLFALFVWDLSDGAGSPFRELFTLCALTLFFYPGAAHKLAEGHKRLSQEYTALASPGVLKGMKAGSRQALAFQAIISSMDDYSGKYPAGSLQNASIDALYTAFANELSNFRPLTLYWSGFTRIYPDYQARCVEYARVRRPLTISNNYPVIYDGYTIKAFVFSDKTKRIYISAPGDPGSAWYITRLSPVTPGAGVPRDENAPYGLDLQFSNTHARSVRAISIAAYDSSGRLKGSWLPVLHLADSITFDYKNGGSAAARGLMERELAVPSGGKIKLFINCRDSACSKTARLEIATVMDDDTRFRQTIYFLAPDPRLFRIRVS